MAEIDYCSGVFGSLSLNKEVEAHTGKQLVDYWDVLYGVCCRPSSEVGKYVEDVTAVGMIFPQSKKCSNQVVREEVKLLLESDSSKDLATLGDATGAGNKCCCFSCD
ncbi:hypothetical protein C5167_034125 [Papaver somniferum]|uniref:Uncharacterized protein n=1 Tax=Papaver somniferum TaxID=3469 RepID=A0A4Y7KF41_PAPSO|nr:hypothetical protein C5167_034125 [Papaver somniferum]